VRKTLIASAVAAVIAMPAVAQNAGGDRLEQILSELQELKASNERLAAEVEYLKSNALGSRKEAAVEAVDVATLKTAVAKYTWNADLRYRYELIQDEPATNIDASSRQRDRVRMRLGVTGKPADSLTAKVQFSTVNTGDDNPRSTNQTLGETWNRKTVGIDQAYVDWKANRYLNLIVGKQPLPWTSTVSYFWDKDLTPEGATLRFANGPWSAGLYYDWLSERSANNTLTVDNAGLRTDAKMIGAQITRRQSIGKVAFTGAVGYFDVRHVKGEVAATGTGCTINPAFSGSTNGNTTVTATYPNGTGGSVSCTVLASDFNIFNVLLQADTTIGRYPFSAFMDYMQNGGAEVNAVAGKKLDTAIAYGFTFNRAAAARSWEIGYVYQTEEKDSVYGQFHDSDYDGGVTDGEGGVVKAAYVPVAGWTVNGTYFMNKRFIDGVAVGSTGRKRSYDRLQLDLNYRF
jgi:hypothetical protein